MIVKIQIIVIALLFLLIISSCKLFLSAKEWNERGEASSSQGKTGEAVTYYNKAISFLDMINVKSNRKKELKNFIAETQRLFILLYLFPLSLSFRTK